MWIIGRLGDGGGPTFEQQSRGRTGASRIADGVSPKNAG
jgi:hypothetical protein